MNNESLVDYVRRRLREEGADKWPEIAEQAGKFPGTLRHLAHDRKRSFRIDTIEPVANVLRQREGLQ